MKKSVFALILVAMAGFFLYAPLAQAAVIFDNIPDADTELLDSSNGDTSCGVNCWLYFASTTQVALSSGMGIDTRIRAGVSAPTGNGDFGIDFAVYDATHSSQLCTGFNWTTAVSEGGVAYLPNVDYLSSNNLGSVTCDSYSFVQGTTYIIEATMVVADSGLSMEVGMDDRSDFYFQMTSDVFPPAPDPDDGSTHIIRINYPTSGTTTASTTVTFDLDIQQNAEQIASEYTLTIFDGPTGAVVFPESDLFQGVGESYAISSTPGTANYTNATVTLPAGSYTAKFQLYGSAPCDVSICPSGFTRYNINSQRLVNFSVVTLSLPGVIGWDPTAGSTASSSACTLNFGLNIGSCASFLLIPGPQVFAQYTALPGSLMGRVPFSYIASIKNTWTGLVASSTANSPTLSFNLHDTGVGSTSALGNFLPNFVVFSASTTKQSFPPGTFDLLKSLAAIALIMGLFADIFFTTRNVIKT